MPVLSAPGDTWGTSGPDFLVAYLGAAAVFAVAALVARLSVTRSSPATPAGRLPDPAEAAFLLGGRWRAAYSSLAGLRAAGAVGVGNDRTLIVTGPIPAGSNRLDLAVFNAAQRGVRARDLAKDTQVESAMAEIVDNAERAGWLPDSTRLTRARIGAYLLLGLSAFGVVRVIAGIANGRSVGFLIALCIITLASGLLLLRVPRLTRAGRRAVQEIRTRNLHLAPAQAPSWTTYGMAGAAMGVALYGTTALWAADPAFAAEAGLKRMLMPTAGGGSNGTTPSCSGGGGGGSCGGGGGGCGGGGCGG
jgi:uncharacterized protein (TIGR04222 family)